MARTTETRTLALRGCALHYDVHGDLGQPGPHPVLLAIGFPMDAGGFRALADRLDDRVVVTYDPRGVGRSTRAGDDDRLLGPGDHAADLADLIDDLGVPQVDVFGSSGGAINGFALVAQHPEKVHLLVAHEPPLTELLPDRGLIDAANADITATYQQSGYGAAMAKFIRLVMHDGELNDDYLRAPAPDPAMFGLPIRDDGSRDDPLLAGSLHTAPSHQLDAEAVRRVLAKVVVAVGEESGGGIAARAARATAARFGLEPVEFPSHHAGFIEGDPAQGGGRPDEFAARLREVLARTL